MEIIRMPLMSDTMEEGNIVAWLKEEGDVIESGDTLAEVETDKATMELDTYVDGVLLHIAVKEGTVPVDGIIAIIGQKGDDWQAALAEAGSGKAKKVTESSIEILPTQENVPVAEPMAAAVTDGNTGRVKASPLAKSMAKEAGVNLASIKGSGDNGRIVKRDVEQAMGKETPANSPAPTRAIQQAPPTPVFETLSTATDEYEDIPLTQMRKVIARRLGESKFSAPHFYLTIEIDMGGAMQDRKRINEMIAPAKISFNDLVVKAAAVALRSHPKVNASWMGDSIRMNKAINIGVAVGIEEGLLVPVIRHADMKTFSQINAEVKVLAGKAKERKLQPAEMQGNTFTISNLGMFGIEEFTAIVNPPDACIMAVGGIIQKAVVDNGEIVVGHRMKVTLSCDHRVVDGVVGSKFLNTFKDLMESPVRMLA